MPTNYLTQLTLRLHFQVSGLDRDFRNELKSFFLSTGTEAGGFAGKNGQADLYYTGFGLRGLFLLGALDKRGCLQKIQDYLEIQSHRDLSAVEWTSLIFSESLLRLALGEETGEEHRNRALRKLETFRRDDGCFATSAKTSYSSTYQTFLIASAFEILGAEEEKRTIPVEPILRRQQKDGGFVELEKLHRSGTNPTAAAVGFLKMFRTVPDHRKRTIDFLSSRQLPQGGFQANTLTPFPDLLSSFTALVALNDLEATDQCDLQALERFVKTMRSPGGGYCGAEWDRRADVEYTFYGLALQAFLSDVHRNV